MKIYGFIFASFFFFLFDAVSIGAATIDEKTVIFQSFIQEDLLKKDIQQLQTDIDTLQQEQDQLVANLGKILLAYQEQGRFFWLEVLLASTSWHDALNRLYLLQEMTAHQQDLYTKAAEKKTQITARKQLIQYKQTYVQQVQEALFAKEEAPTYRHAFTSLTKQEKDTLIAAHANEWTTTHLTTFNTLYRAFVDTVNAIPSSYVEKRLQKEGWFGVSATISEQDINDLLHQSPALQQLTFSFLDDTLLLSGQAEETAIFAIGHFEQESVHALRFVFDDVLINGLSLPKEVRDNLAASKPFTFIPANFKKGVKLADFTIENKQMQFTLSF